MSRNIKTIRIPCSFGRRCAIDKTWSWLQRKSRPEVNAAIEVSGSNARALGGIAEMELSSAVVTSSIVRISFWGQAPGLQM